MKEQHIIPESALTNITAVLREPKVQFWDQSTPQLALWHCMMFISKKLKIVLKEPVNPGSELTVDQQLKSLCKNSGLQVRMIELSGSWWKKDIGPVLTFYESFDHPAAIIPESFNRYLLVVPSKNIKCRLTEKLAQKFINNAMMFYRTLPEKKLSWRDVARFSFTNLSVDIAHVVSMQLLIAILGFMVPIAIGILVEQVIPNASYSLLQQLIILLSVNVFVMTLFNTVLVISSLRIRLKITASLQAAVWDRVIRLPIHFFRRFTAGDLANRASGVDQVQQIITNSVFVSMSSGVLSLVSLALMFYYSYALFLGTVILIIILALITLIANVRQLNYLRENLFLQGKLTGFVLQIISSVSKIKMTNSAANVFVQWSKLFSEKNHMLYQSGKIVIGMTVFSTAFSVISTIVMFSLVFVFGEQLSFGNFITFNALFSQCFTAIFALISALTSSMLIFPLYERIKPIIESLPESEQSGMHMDTLTGKIDCTNINFQYNEETPVVFKDLNIAVKPGEKVAFVGRSGSGKSTLFRLLLGLEQPQSGKIYYSDIDLSSVNIRSIREQIGVVLQDSVLFSASILENIVGYSNVMDINLVEMIIEQVGFAEELKTMPMGLNTVLTEQGRTLSNGQRQRLLLARALFKQPNLLLLDEATSSLDNITQEKIYHHLATLNLTCLFIAHRVSTLKFADKIYVIDNGTIVQSGTFNALIEKEGLFKHLVARSLS